MAKFDQIQPSGCSGRVHPNDMDHDSRFRNDSLYWAEIKEDGARYLTHVTPNLVYLTGRRISRVTGEFVEKTHNVPHLNDPGQWGIPTKECKNTVFDGEIVYGNGVHNVTSIMGASPGLAVERQEQLGWVDYVIFDILFYQGEDVRDLSNYRRRLLLESVWNEHLKYHCHLKLTKTFTSQKRDLFWQVIADGGEGIVLKDANAPYGTGWIKVKKILEGSVVVVGFTQGRGKYANTIGAICFGQYVNGELVEFGQCSGITDTMRYEISDNPLSFIGRVMDIKFQERFESGKFREPRFLRWRPDLNAKEIKWKK